MQRRLLRDGWGPVCCLDYRSLTFDVEGAAAHLRHTVDRLRDDLGPAQPITLVGHSLGGLVLRYYARRYPAPAVRRIVTLGTPHGGTVLARRERGYGRTLAPGSSFLTALHAADRVPQQFDVIAIHSSFDAMILPPRNAEYAGAFNIQVAGIGHNALLFSSKIYGLIAENLKAPLVR
jgi:triacylglycerol esterase/lipase EstA (alpha/beta hydrolase family)